MDKVKAMNLWNTLRQFMAHFGRNWVIKHLLQKNISSINCTNKWKTIYASKCPTYLVVTGGPIFKDKQANAPKVPRHLYIS
jgi:hypothetical protein